MAEKWADYLISAVRYNGPGTHIDQVRYHPDYGETVGNGLDAARQTIVEAINAGTSFVTIYKSPNDATKWNRGADVRVVAIDGKAYIRTDPDDTKQDSLGDLPRY